MTDLLPADLEQWLTANDARIHTELFDFLKIPSVSARTEHAGDVARAANWLADALTSIGFTAALHPTPGHPIVLAEWRQARAGAPTVLIYGHYDVMCSRRNRSISGTRRRSSPRSATGGSSRAARSMTKDSSSFT
jgi:hypothetical protein